MVCCEFLEEYKGFEITKDNTVKKFLVYAIVGEYEDNNKTHLSGGSIDILKRKIDKWIKKEGLKS